MRVLRDLPGLEGQAPLAALRQQLAVGDGEGAPIKAEIWALDAAAFGAFVARIPPPLGVGALRLAGGGSVKGFLVEAQATIGAEDISALGGWRAYLARK